MADLLKLSRLVVLGLLLQGTACVSFAASADILQPMGHLNAAVDGRNIVQPNHYEMLGDNSNGVGIKCEMYGNLAWSW